ASVAEPKPRSAGRPGRTGGARRAAGREPAAAAPVARVCVDVPLPHLDRPFDYLVPADLDADAVPGVRVRIRFSGQLVDGYLLARAEASEHPGRLTFLERVVSPEPVVGPDTLALARAVAQRYAGTLADVLRLAVPPRHARAEAAPAAAPAGPAAAPPGPVVAPAGSASTVPAPAGSASTVPGPAGSAGTVPGPGAAADFAGWAAYPAGRAFLTGLAQRRNPRAVWTALPGEDWPARLAEAVAATVHGGRGAVVTVADARDLDRLDAALSALLGPGRHVALSAALGPAERYRRWLATGGAREAVAPREVVRTRSPAVVPTADDPRDQAPARLPSLAWRAARDALATGAPVLVQVPRRGYLPSVACADCRTPARCA